MKTFTLTSDELRTLDYLLSRRWELMLQGSWMEEDRRQCTEVSLDRGRHRITLRGDLSEALMLLCEEDFRKNAEDKERTCLED